MQFDSLSFIPFFFLLLIIYNLLSSWDKRKTVLLFASYLFYSAWNPLFLPLLIISSLFDYYMAKEMAKSEGRKRKLYLIIIVSLSVIVLCYFKYINFILSDVLVAGFSIINIGLSIPEYNILLPLGISFYTFHSLSYCIDIYNRKFEPSDSWRDYCLYVAFFPQLVAGPIVRWTSMSEQIKTPRSTTADGLFIGFIFLVVGLFEKVFLADTIFAPMANQLFSAERLSTAQAWIAALSFSGQIFCDFAGYSTCAIGAALMLGFQLPINFKNPYSAISLSDFWQRWHISLSSWLRDYLYIPLGGNRSGQWLTYRNLLITMLIGGLWHGAAWTFIVWGGLHGLYLIVERFFEKNNLFFKFVPSALRSLCGWGVTFLAVIYAWVWFRSESVSHAVDLTKKLFSLNELSQSIKLVTNSEFLIVIVFFILVLIQCFYRNKDLYSLVEKAPITLIVLSAALLLFLVMVSSGEGSAFIYFQF